MKRYSLIHSDCQSQLFLVSALSKLSQIVTVWDESVDICDTWQTLTEVNVLKKRWVDLLTYQTLKNPTQNSCYDA